MKVLASDFDGTLVFNDKFRKEDLKKIKEFQKEGNLVGLCSGRPFKGVYEFCKKYLDLDFYILCTGALVLDKDGNELFKSTITKQSLENYFNRYQDKYEIYIQANKQIYTYDKKEMGSMVRKVINSLDEVEGDIYGLSMFALTDENARKVCLDIEENFPELATHQNKAYIDVTAKGCSKGLGINKLKEIYHIDNIAGIGDSYNDISMLETVDTSFTFHSSPDSLTSIVDHVVDSVSQAIDILNEDTTTI